MTDLQLIPVSSADAPALADLRVQAMRESLEAIGRFDPQRARERFLASFTPEDTQTLVTDGERIGFVVIRCRPDHILLDHLYILPAHQGRGFGAQVLQRIFAEADAAELPVRVGALKGSRSNDFYRHHGFVLVEAAEWDNHYVREPMAKSIIGTMRIYADFNGLQGSPNAPAVEWVPLDTWGTLCDLTVAGIILTEGMRLTIYSDSSEEEDLEADTVARYSRELNCWVAEIDSSGIREALTRGHEVKQLVCVACKKALDGFVREQGLNDKTRCPSCGTIVHLPILPPNRLIG